jgi:DNA-binding CsgD family transcriptional regulator/PAS domain-containing protein
LIQDYLRQVAVPSFVDSAFDDEVRACASDRDLSAVLAEIAGLMGADGACLTLHPVQDRPPVFLCSGHARGDDPAEMLFRTVGRMVLRDIVDATSHWRDASSDPGCAILLMPIDQLPGHSRLLVSVLFRDISSERRAAAERMYRERRPFAVGFFQLWQRGRLLERRMRSLETALDQTAAGLVLLNAAGRIIYANQTADEILTEGDGIGHNNGMLRATNLRDGVNLQAAINHAICGQDGRGTGSVRTPLLSFQRRSRTPLIAAVLSVPGAAVEPDDAAAIVYMVDPALDIRAMLTSVCGIYHLSPVETALVCHLAAGKSLADAALLMHVKEQTARGYLKTIFIKTGTRRQAELVALMLSSLVRTKRGVFQEAIETDEG